MHTHTTRGWYTLRMPAGITALTMRKLHRYKSLSSQLESYPFPHLMVTFARGGEESNKGPRSPRTANGHSVSRPISRTANGRTVSRPHSHWVLAPGAIQEPVRNLLAPGHRLNDRGTQPVGYTPLVKEQGMQCRVRTSGRQTAS